MADLGWTKHISDVEKAESLRLYVHEISWMTYPGATDADKVVYTVECALRELPRSIQDEIEKIIIGRGENPNE